MRHSPNSSGSSTPTNSLNDGNFDGQDSDQLSDTRSIQSQILSPGKDEEYDSVPGNDIPPLQNRRVRNPTSVLQRISSLMAIRNNVRILNTLVNGTWQLTTSKCNLCLVGELGQFIELQKHRTPSILDARQ